MLTTLDRVKAELIGTEVYKPNGIEQQIMGYIRNVSQRISNFGWRFEPKYYTRRLTPNPMIVNTRIGSLVLGDDLVEVDAISNNGNAMSYGSQVLNYPNDGQFPIQRLRIADLCTAPINSWYPCCTSNPFETILITGWWAMHTYPDGITGGWLLSGNPSSDSIQNVGGINAGTNSIAVQDVDGEDYLGRTPRFSAGNLIRVDNEMMEIQSTDTDNNTMKVNRGVRGTTATDHDQNAEIRIWEPEQTIVNMATRQTCLLVARRGAFQQVTTPDGVSITYPADLLSEIKNTLHMYSYVGTS